jgi:predicted Rossmann fold nucleotide-binding protein DprA/Smf involved in DNA uptake
MSNYPETVYWLTLIQKSGLKLNILKPIILRWCLTDRRSLADLFTLSPLELTTTFGLTDANAEAILAAAPQFPAMAGTLAQWQSQGIETLIRTDARYPKRLTRALSLAKQPLVLWAKGDIRLLNRPAVTIMGQDSPDPTQTAFITELITTLEAAEVGLISGYSRGLDRSTYELITATAAGFAVIMLPMGLAAFAQTTTRLDASVQAGQTLLVSPFPPETTYNEKLAEARNLLIDHLALALLIPDSDEESQARGMAALERGLPVLVKSDTANNRDLLGKEALLLTDPGEVIEWVQQMMVDEVLLEDDDAPESVFEAQVAAPLAATAPAEPELSTEDYSLRAEEIPPIDSAEALELLSLGGEIPPILRDRLLKAKDKDNTD